MYLLDHCSKEIKLAFLQCMGESLTSVGLVSLIKQRFLLCGRQMSALLRTLVMQQANGWGAVSSRHLGMCALDNWATSKTLPTYQQTEDWKHWYHAVSSLPSADNVCAGALGALFKGTQHHTGNSCSLSAVAGWGSRITMLFGMELVFLLLDASRCAQIAHTIQRWC